MKPSQIILTGKHRRYLRALGHHLEPVVQLGKNGLNDAVASAADEALTRHELVKIRLGTECPDERGDVATALSENILSAGADLASVMSGLMKAAEKTRETREQAHVLEDGLDGMKAE